MAQQLSGKPTIDYPCEWDYRIIGSDEDALRGAVAEIVGEEEYTLEKNRDSKKGRWLSLHLRLIVVNESHREGIYRALCDHPAVQLVL